MNAARLREVRLRAEIGLPVPAEDVVEMGEALADAYSVAEATDGGELYLEVSRLKDENAELRNKRAALKDDLDAVRHELQVVQARCDEYAAENRALERQRGRAEAETARLWDMRIRDAAAHGGGK